MRPLLLVGLLLAGMGAAFALAGTSSTGTVTACATASLPAETIQANGAPVGTIPGASDTECSVSTFTVPTVTVTETVTTTLATTTATPAATPAAFGEQLGADSLGNLQIGGTLGRQVAIRFRSAGGTLASVTVFFVYTSAPGYYGGTGGQIRVDLASDNAGVPGKTIASQTLTSMLSGNFRTVTWSTPPTLAAGLYELVLTNADPSPAVNYVSVDDLYSGAPTTPRQPTVPDADLAVLMRDGSGSWAVNLRHTPIVRAAYTDGTVFGQTYRDVRSSSGLSPVGGQAQIRETMTLPATIGSTGVWVRLERQQGTTAPLVGTLKGPVGAEASVSASAVATVPGWVWLAWPSPLLLPAGAYTLTLSSTETAAPYRAWPFEDGSGTTLATSPLQFDAGKAQASSDGGATWVDGSAKTTARGSNLDWQLYLAGSAG